MDPIVRLVFASKISATQRSHRSRIQLQVLTFLDALLQLKSEFPNETSSSILNKDLGFSWLSRSARDVDVQLRIAATKIFMHFCRPFAKESLFEMIKVFNFQRRLLNF